jgi:hypothetical protein
MVAASIFLQRFVNGLRYLPAGQVVGSIFTLSSLMQLPVFGLIVFPFGQVWNS